MAFLTHIAALSCVENSSIVRTDEGTCIVVAAGPDGGGRKRKKRVKEVVERKPSEQPRGPTRFGRLLILHRDNESPADLPVPFSCSWRQFQTTCFSPISSPFCAHPKLNSIQYVWYPLI